jgi:diguanylate cyclase (GGDEF)-like protein
MDLYLLSSDPELEALCTHALDGLRVNVRKISSMSAIGPDPTDLACAILLADGRYLEEHPDEIQTLARFPFLRVALVSRGDGIEEPIEDDGADNHEVIRNPELATLRYRFLDWASLESLNREGRVQAKQIHELALALETASQDITALRQKISFLDRQRDKLGRVLETMNMLGRLSHEINCLDLDEIINICTTKIPLLVNARYSSFYLHNYQDRKLELKRHNHGYPIDDVVRVDESSPSAMCRALFERRILLIRDFDEYEETQHMAVERPHAEKYSSRSCIIAPMLAGDRVVAVLNLADKRTGGFFDEVNDLPPIEQISALVGTAIRNWQLFQEVRQQAKTDAMTNFINHQTFFEELEREVHRVRRYQGALSVLMIDVDNFKTFNDEYGHQIGDTILAEVARIIRANVRDTDTPARYGGDEFAVILSQADGERARMIAERIRETVHSRDFAVGENKVALSLSIGVAQYHPGQSVKDFLNDADKALYEAKARGRNRVEMVAAAV